MSIAVGAAKTNKGALFVTLLEGPEARLAPGEWFPGWSKPIALPGRYTLEDFSVRTEYEEDRVFIIEVPDESYN